MFRLLALSWLARRRTIAAVSLLGLVAATVGIPVLQPARDPNGKDLSQPFPCMHSVCGCQNATACWQACCCHTNREKVVWAKANGVTPPDYVVAAAAQEARATATAHSCCSSKGCEDDEPDTNIATDESAAKGGLRLTLVSAVAARHCQGLPQLFMLLSAALPVCSASAWKPEQPTSGWIATWSATSISIDERPATPPPRA